MPEKSVNTSTSRSVLITAVVLAVIAVVLVNLYVRSMERRHRRGLVRVVEAKRRLERGRVPTRDDVRIVEIGPLSPSVAQRYVKADQLASIIEGRRPLIQAVEKNERLLWSHFVQDSSEPILDRVPKGYRYLTLPVDSRTSPGPLLQPGMYVDVLATLPAERSTGRPAVTLTLLERVLVYAVGGRTLYDPLPNRPNYSTVTLQVKREQAEKLATIVSYLRGGVTLLLRNSQEPVQGSGDHLEEAMRVLGLSGSSPPSPRPGRRR